MAQKRASGRPCWAEISLDALRHNYCALQDKLSPSTSMLAMIKANAYGHGLVEISKALDALSPAFYGVTSVEEGVYLRQSGCQRRILVLGPLFPFDSIDALFAYDLTPTIAGVESAEALQARAAEKKLSIPVHLKIDSGFGRIGVRVSNAMDFVKNVSACSNLKMEGLYTHFASADVDPIYTDVQRNAFHSLVEKLLKSGFSFPFVHMANSAALVRFPKTHGTLVRPGLALYGLSLYDGSEKDIALQAVLQWKTQVIFLKKMLPGESISYARTWTCSRESTIATVSVGYADGFSRALSNKGEVLVRGHRVPVVGRVTMDMTMLDVTDVPDCRIGDEVVLIGSQGGQTLTAWDMANRLETNAYEVVSTISSRVPRIYHGIN